MQEAIQGRIKCVLADKACDVSRAGLGELRSKACDSRFLPNDRLMDRLL